MLARLNNLNPLACFQKQRPPIGIDFGAYSIKAIQLTESHGRWSLQAAAEVPLTSTIGEDRAQRISATTAALQQLLQSAPFIGREVVTSLPASVVQYKSLRLPPMPSHELAKAVEWEAADRMELGAKGSHIQFFDAGEVRQGADLKQELIVMAVPPDAIDDHVAVLSNCNLDPQVIEVAPSAIARAAQTGTKTDAAQVIVDIGYLSTKVLIVKQGRVLFYKQIDIGGQQFDAEVAHATNLSPKEAARARRRLNHNGATDFSFEEGDRVIDEAAIAPALENSIGQLSREIGLCLRYYSVTFRGGRPETVQLIGGEARQPWLPAALAVGAGVDFAPFNVLAGVDTTTNPTHINTTGAAACPWAVAVGLSRRPLESKSQKGAA